MVGAMRPAAVVRSALTWTVVTAALAGGAAVALPAVLAAVAGLAGPPPERAVFSELVTGCCALSALGAGGWLWALTTDVALRAVRGGGVVAGSRGLSGRLRTAVAVACGVAVLTTAPAGADPGPAEPPPTSARILDGLPLPDRAEPPERADRVHRPDPPDRRHAPDDARIRTSPQEERPAAPTARRVTVRPGDSLWAIAARHLAAHGLEAERAAVARLWPRVYDANEGVLGTDPDLIRPGQRLWLPPVRPLDQHDRSRR